MQDPLHIEEKRIIVGNHKTLAKGSATFIESMLSQPHLVAEQCHAVRSGDIPAAYEKLRELTSPWPVIISSKYKNEMAVINRDIGILLYKSMLIISRDYPTLFKQQYDIPAQWFADLNENDGARQFMIGRYDALISRGALKLLEYNAGSNIGGWHLYRLIDFYRDIVGDINHLNYTPILEEFLASIERMIEQKIVGEGSPYNLLFVLENEHEKDDFVASLPYFEEAINKRQLQLRLLFDVNFQKLEVDENGAWFNGERVDAVSVPVFNFDSGTEKVQQLMKLHWQNRVVFPDNPIYLALGNKSCFANLYFLMQENRLSSKEVELVSKYIPWTHHLGDELNRLIGQGASFDVSNILNNKDDFVLKRDGLLGGDHVYVGKFTSESTWYSVVSLARKNPGWIVQKYYPSDQFYAPTYEGNIVPHDYVLGFFDLGSEYGGAGVRLMPSKLNNGVVNSAKGADYTMVFEQAQQILMI